MSVKATGAEAFATERDAQLRLGQMGAVYKPDVSTSSKWVYWASKKGSWVTVTRYSGRIVISYYKECPCSG